MIVLVNAFCESIRELSEAYDRAMARSRNVSIGSTTTRVSDVLETEPILSAVHQFPGLHDICQQRLGDRYRLSSFHARTVHPYAKAQNLHRDDRGDPASPQLVSFILAVDDFRPENGATIFIQNGREVVAVAPAGSLIVFDGTEVHGHGENRTATPRRSLQGAFVGRRGD